MTCKSCFLIVTSDHEKIDSSIDETRDIDTTIVLIISISVTPSSSGSVHEVHVMLLRRGAPGVPLLPHAPARGATGMTVV